MSLICPICQDNLVNTESIDNYVNKCGHVYHSACLLPWWDRNADPTCPECRQPCNMDTINKIFLNVDRSDEEIRDPVSLSIPDVDVKTEALLRQLKEYIDLQTYNQTKDINDKFRQQNTEFSTLLLNCNQRLTSNYNDKLSSVSKELADVISDEHKRLITELNSQQRPGHSKSFNASTATQYSTDEPVRFGFVRNLLISCRSNWWSSCVAPLIALLCLIAVIIYSNFILHAVKSTEHSGDIKTLNVSRRLDMLNMELNQISEDFKHDNKYILTRLDSVQEKIRTGVNTQGITNRFNELNGKTDKLLLEQIQTDRRVNMKLDVVQNSINMLKTEMEAKRTSDGQFSPGDRAALSKLEDDNNNLRIKLDRLQSLLAEKEHLKADELRKQIENDQELSPQNREGRNMWDESADIWHKFTEAIGVDSGCGGNASAHITWIIACTFGAYIIHIYRY